jgi:hypothetical protein
MIAAGILQMVFQKGIKQLDLLYFCLQVYKSFRLLPNLECRKSHTSVEIQILAAEWLKLSSCLLMFSKESVRKKSKKFLQVSFCFFDPMTHH